MLHEPPTSVTKDLPMPTSVTLLKLSTKKPRVWVSGLLVHIPKTPRHCLLPLPELKFMPLSSIFRWVKPPSSHGQEQGHLQPLWRERTLGQQMSEQAHFAMKLCSDTTKPNRYSSGPSRCPGHGN